MMVDLHAHMLPGVDDGAETLEDAVEMCRLAAASGCGAMVATPHQRRQWANQNPARLGEKLERVQRQVPDLELHLGAEIRVDDELLDELGGVERSGLLPLGNSNYLLLEFDGHRTDEQLEACVHELVVAGWRPIVAHPELSPCFREDSDRLPSLVRLGAKSQVTAMSVSGAFGRRAQRVAFDLIDRGLVHFLASDAHSPTWRPPGMESAAEEVERVWGPAAVATLMEQNPGAVLSDRELVS